MNPRDFDSLRPGHPVTVPRYSPGSGAIAKVRGTITKLDEPQPVSPSPGASPAGRTPCGRGTRSTWNRGACPSRDLLVRSPQHQRPQVRTRRQFPGEGRGMLSTSAPLIHQVHTRDGFGIMGDAPTAKPQTFRTGDGWFPYNLVTNLAQMQG